MNAKGSKDKRPENQEDRGITGQDRGRGERDVEAFRWAGYTPSDSPMESEHFI